ncbi:hypothetical protein BZA05DRAFT_335943 [Tricharina praecox]|uniref:uncharacterized protein n=1 Tax=Tricharina praecox TaxID=43433 RepID=UPI00221E5A4B|nr:uncharacterized protein BZA05DRAFT_335943 [Tricharina praecox]KAI5853773.1 hypothetical protein BZA05DRAFT_335943 [Tricharina praecox]
MQNNVKPRQHFLESLKFRFGGVKKPSRSRETGVLSHETSHPADEKSFEKICFELACVDHCEVGSEKIAQMFELQELNIKMAVLSEGFRIVLPPYLDLPGLGDIEEQGVGGTCDQFIGSLPPSCRKVSEKASPLGLVPKLLPHGLISKGARYVGSCFWIWLCIVDDLTENLLGKEWDDCEADLFLAFSKDVDESLFNDKDNQAVRVSLALRNVIHSTSICTGVVDSVKEAPWRQAFMDAVCEVLTGFREERPLLETNRIAMYEWMRVRAITISVRPFLILARADLGLMPVISHLGNPLDSGYLDVAATIDKANMSNLRKVECMLQLIMGLQNDILGWEKDYKTENPLSAIQILIKCGSKPNIAVARVIDTHNELVRRCVQHAGTVCDDPNEHVRLLNGDSGTHHTSKNFRPHVFGVFGHPREAHPNRGTVPRENVRAYIQLILGFANGMAKWMAVSKRYTS